MAKRRQRKTAKHPARQIDPMTDPVAAALQICSRGMPAEFAAAASSYQPPPPARRERFQPPTEPRSQAKTLADLFREPIIPISGRGGSDCGVCAVCAAGGLSYAEFLELDPRTPAEIERRDAQGKGLWAREMVKILEATWPGSSWYVQPVGGKPPVSEYRFKPPRGVVYTPGHWVAFQNLGGRVTIADRDSLIPAEQYVGEGITVSKLVAPSPDCVEPAAAAMIKRARILTAEK
jgi:hypothetical protein